MLLTRIFFSHKVFYSFKIIFQLRNSLPHDLDFYQSSRRGLSKRLCGNRRKCCLPAVSPFPTFSSLQKKTKFLFVSYFYFVTCKCSEFGQVQNFVNSLATFNDPQSLLKILWEKEKMLVTSIFSFSHNIFYPFQKEFVFKLHLFCCLQMLSI